MDWFKHSTSSHDDPFIDELMRRFGHFGYAGYFILCEVYGEEYNHLDGDGNLTVTRAFLRQKLRTTDVKAEQLLTFCSTFVLQTSTQPRLSYSVTDNTFTYNIPKYIKIASNWVGRKKHSPTEGPTEGPTAKEIEEEIEEEKIGIVRINYHSQEYQSKKKQATEVLDYLNEKCKKSYQPLPVNLKRIIDRLSDGYSPEILKQVIDTKRSDENFKQEWLTPTTLFDEEKFQNYIQLIGKQEPSTTPEEIEHIRKLSMV